MVGIIVISHGMLCEGIVDSVSMVAGEIEQMKMVSLKPGMSPETYSVMVKDAIKEVDTGDGAVVFVDLIGGTPFNTIGMLSRDLNVEIVTGMNMAMLVMVALERNEDSTMSDLAEAARQAGLEGIRILKRN